MKILQSDLKKGEMKVRTENQDDVLALSSVISAGDFVSGVCERKIKVGEKEKASRKKYFLTILAEKTDFDGSMLRVNGKTTEEKEEIPKGSYQTIEVFPGADIRIKKAEWSAYHLKKIKDSAFESKQKILIVVFDRENAIFAKTKKTGFDVLLELEGDVSKKAYEIKKESWFFQQVIDKIREYAERFRITNIIIASPAFWKEDLIKLVKDSSLKEKIISAGCSSVSENAIYEVLKSDATRKILEQERAVTEISIVEEVVKEISKGGAVAYGIEEVTSVIEAGNIRSLIFTDRFFNETQKSEKREFFEGLMKKAENLRAELHIISSEHEGGKRLDGLGGIAALLRYKSYS